MNSSLNRHCSSRSVCHDPVVLKTPGAPTALPKVAPPHRRRPVTPISAGLRSIDKIRGFFKSAFLATLFMVVSTHSAASAMDRFGLADWDQDGHQDIMVRDDVTNVLWLYPGQSVRGYSSAPRVQIGHGAAGYTPFGLADWDRDGHRDMLLREDATGILWLYPGQSVRGYSSAPRVEIGNGWSGYTAFGLADWDRDGHQDIVAREDATGVLWLYPGQSVRGYSSAPRVQIGHGWFGYTAFGLADWDRDGHQDIVAQENATGLLWLYPGQSVLGYSTVPRVRIGNGW